MKVNDIVKVFDGSYSMSLIKGKMRHETGNALLNRRFRLLAYGEYPTVKSERSGTNDIMLVDTVDPDFVLFSQKRFCNVTFPSAPAPETQLEVTVPHGTKNIHLILR